MIESYLPMQLALRGRAQALEVVDSAAMLLSASGVEYVRSSGSFLADGFAPGMELTASGFRQASNNGLAIITGASALRLTVDRDLVAEPEQTPRSGMPWGDPYWWTGLEQGKRLRVLFPSTRVWENLEAIQVDENGAVTVSADPELPAPYIEEEFVPGPTRQVTCGSMGEVEFRPLYIVRFNVLENVGIGAARRYTQSFMRQFAPGTPIALSTGDVMRVMRRPGPFLSQSKKSKPGYTGVTVTVPLELRTRNSI